MWCSFFPNLWNYSSCNSAKIRNKIEDTLLGREPLWDRLTNLLCDRCPPVYGLLARSRTTAAIRLNITGFNVFAGLSDATVNFRRVKLWELELTFSACLLLLLWQHFNVSHFDLSENFLWLLPVVWINIYLWASFPFLRKDSRLRRSQCSSHIPQFQLLNQMNSFHIFYMNSVILEFIPTSYTLIIRKLQFNCN
jgi:hypothetical protein